VTLKKQSYLTVTVDTMKMLLLWAEIIMQMGAKFTFDQITTPLEFW